MAKVDEHPDVPTSYGAPRTLLYVTVKRDNTSWRSIYGHWWVEVGDSESYGWWPAAVPLAVRDLVVGTDGILNAVGLLGLRGTWYQDPNHGQPAVHVFHPVLSMVKPDDQVREEIRSFAHGYRAAWRWHWSSARASGTCRVFQDELLAAVGLMEGLDQLHTRGSGCPFLYPFRHVAGRIADGLDDLACRPVPWAGRVLAGAVVVDSLPAGRPTEGHEHERPAEAQMPFARSATRGSCSSAR